MKKTPDEIRQMFDDAITGKADISIDDCIWALLDDVIGSMRKAEHCELGNGNGSDGPVTWEVCDYLTNHYG